MGNPNEDARRMHSLAEKRINHRHAQINNMPDTNRGKWELAEKLLIESREDLNRFSEEHSVSQEAQGALEMIEALNATIAALNSPVLLGSTAGSAGQ